MLPPEQTWPLASLQSKAYIQYASQFGLGAGGSVPAECLVLLGDNQAVSVDSRHFGYVLRSQVEAVLAD